MNESFRNPSALPPRIIWRTDGKEMVLVPSGPFVLGIDNPLRGQDGPAHTVTLPAYYIDRAPVTIGEFLHFAAATGYPLPRPLRDRRISRYANYPVAGVAWHDAYAYTTWAGKRLPTEAEWEKAASWDWATNTKRCYPWGDLWDPRRCNMLEGGAGRTTPVGAYSPYGDAVCGAVDMAGNVYEWTLSLNWNYPYRPGDGRDNPDRRGTHVRRGGAFASEELYVRATTRQLNEPDLWLATEGFRCAWPVDG